MTISLRSRRVLFLFVATIFLSALLLFWSQLVIAKMLLPRLGGTPAVWNTCMLFFQVLLLAGYSYVVFTTMWLGVRAQAILHSALILLAVVYLPLTFVGNVGPLSVQNNPALALFGYLLSAIGLPIFLISTTSPLLQKWFTRTSHASANDPYFLFAVSNGGSLVALLSYPLFLEPNLKLSLQNDVWVALFVVFLVLSLGCVLVLWRSSRSEQGTAPADPVAAANPSISLKQRFYWILLAFIPASLLFGVTSYITTEIAPTPLLWTIPLALYLGTFVVAFSRPDWFPQPLASTAVGGLALLLTLVIAAEATEPTTAIVLLHLCFFFVAAMLCHNTLASDRPVAARLAEFYLCVAIGGMLGGLFNTLIAPNIFNSLVEYPLVIVLACLIRPREEDSDGRLFEVIGAVCIGLLTIVLALFINRFELDTIREVAVVFGIPLVITNHLFRKRPIGFALAVGAVMLGSVVYSEIQNRTLHVERNFFGSLSVRVDPLSATRVLFHGNTIHGRQFMDPDLQQEPLSYFHRDGPLGRIFEAFNTSAASPNVAIVGLGAGSMACYALPDQHWAFYEINPAVVSIAQSPEYFTYLQKCAPASTEIILGDARLQLQNAPDHHYGLIILDAFNSDAVPVHLMTVEAVTLYASKLAKGGMLVFQVSNRSLKLDAVLADVAAQNGLQVLSIADEKLDVVRGKDPSEWVVMGRDSAAFDSLAQQPGWRALQGRPESHAWTDDFSNILRAFRWY